MSLHCTRSSFFGLRYTVLPFCRWAMSGKVSRQLCDVVAPVRLSAELRPVWTPGLVFRISRGQSRAEDHPPTRISLG